MGERRIVLVAGAAGGVGEGIVRQLLLRVPDVLVIGTSRSEERLAALGKRLGRVDVARFVPMVGDAGTREGAAAIVAQVEAEHGPVDVAIPSLGGWWEGGPLLQVGVATWNAVMHEMLGTHVAFAQTVIPRLVPGALYLAIGGGAGLTPVADASLVSIAGAAQLMLTRVLAAELVDVDVRILELVANGPVRTYENPDGPLTWMTADDVGEVVAALVAGVAARWPWLRRRDPIVTMDEAARPYTTATVTPLGVRFENGWFLDWKSTDTPQARAFFRIEDDVVVFRWEGPSGANERAWTADGQQRWFLDGPPASTLTVNRAHTAIVLPHGELPIPSALFHVTMRRDHVFVVLPRYGNVAPRDREPERNVYAYDTSGRLLWQIADPPEIGGAYEFSTIRDDGRVIAQAGGFVSIVDAETGKRVGVIYNVR